MGNSANFKDLTGQRFGKLTVVKQVGTVSEKDRHALWLCKCDCGNTTTSVGYRLQRGDKKSCGCINHHLSSTRLYNIWARMKDRCGNKNHKHYCYYGGNGVCVCEEWKNSFDAFYEWAIANGYEENLTLDRIDSNGIYEPSNCRWATRHEQMLNTSRNRRITYNGETLTVCEWAERIGVNQNTLLYRLRRGWSVERALTKRV